MGDREQTEALGFEETLTPGFPSCGGDRARTPSVPKPRRVETGPSLFQNKAAPSMFVKGMREALGSLGSPGMGIPRGMFFNYRGYSSSIPTGSVRLGFTVPPIPQTIPPPKNCCPPCQELNQKTAVPKNHDETKENWVWRGELKRGE